MAHQMPVPQQTQYSVPQQQQQHQNIGQRHASNTQQSFGQSMAGEGQSMIPDTIQGPLLVSFILEKPRNATSWEDVVPEQQHVSVHDLKKEVHKFRRNHNSVKKALNEISSPNCRRIINELVEEQNVALSKLNPAMEYRIVSVVNKFREHNSLTRRERHIVRVDIILEAEDSGIQATRMGVETSSSELDHNRARQGNGLPQVPSQINHPSQNMSAQQQMPQQRPHYQAPHSMGPPPHSELPRAQPPLNQAHSHMPMNNQAPPPPPPPPPPHMSGGMNGQTPMAGPSMAGPPQQQPPPPTGGHAAMPRPQMPQQPMQNHIRQGASRMPGSYPEAMPTPMPRSVPGQRPAPLNETIDHELLRRLWAKYKNRTDISSPSSESDISWEDESGSSSFVDIGSISHDETSGREHDRGRHAKKTKKTSKHRVHSRSKRQSRSRSQSRPRRAVHEQHAQRPERRHRTNSSINDGHNVRRSPASSGSSSPEPLHANLSSQVPGNIYINLTTPNTGDDRTRSGNASPISLSHDKKKPAKIYTSHDEASDVSWDRASGTDSWNTTSTHTAEDGTWDAPLRSHTPRHSSHKPVSPHHHRRHPPIDPRSIPRHQRNHTPSPPPLRSSMRNHSRSRSRSRDHYFTPQPQPRPDLPHRRTTTTSFPSPPPNTSGPPKLPRAYSFPSPPVPATHASYPQRSRNMRDFVATAGAARDEQIDLRDLQDALEWARERRKEKEQSEMERERERERDAGGRGGRYGDAGRRRRDSGVWDEEDEWAFGFDGGRGRERGYRGY